MIALKSLREQEYLCTALIHPLDINFPIFLLIALSREIGIDERQGSFMSKLLGSTHRSEMSMAALQGGMAIYMGLGPIHALSMAFGDSPLHHGTLVTVSMPAIMRFYNSKLENGKLEKFAEAMNLTEDKDPGNRIADAVAELNSKMGLPSTVREMGYDKTDVDRMVKDCCDSHFNFPAPVCPSPEEYKKIVIEVLG